VIYENDGTDNDIRGLRQPDEMAVDVGTKSWLNIRK
jgi:hypothetical protein